MDEIVERIMSLSLRLAEIEHSMYSDMSGKQRVKDNVLSLAARIAAVQHAARGAAEQGECLVSAASSAEAKRPEDAAEDINAQIMALRSQLIAIVKSASAAVPDKQESNAQLSEPDSPVAAVDLCPQTLNDITDESLRKELGLKHWQIIAKFKKLATAGKVINGNEHLKTARFWDKKGFFGYAAELIGELWNSFDGVRVSNICTIPFDEVSASKFLIAFDSHSSVIRGIVVEEIYKIIGGELYEIRCAPPYPVDGMYSYEKISGSLKPALLGELPDVSGYDMIILCYPNRFGTISPPIKSFLSAIDTSGKTIAPLITPSIPLDRSNPKRTVKDIIKLCPNSNIHYFDNTRRDTLEELLKFCKPA